MPTRKNRIERRTEPIASPPRAQLTELHRTVLPFDKSTLKHAASELSPTRNNRTVFSRESQFMVSNWREE